MIATDLFGEWRRATLSPCQVKRDPTSAVASSNSQEEIHVQSDKIQFERAPIEGNLFNI